MAAKENLIIIENDQDAGRALLKDMSKLCAKPYIVAEGFKALDLEWESCNEHASLADAVEDYAQVRRNPYRDADMVSTISWYREDVAQAIEYRAGEGLATEANVDIVVGKIGKCLRERSIEEGWEILYQLVDEADLA